MMIRCAISAQDCGFMTFPCPLMLPFVKELNEKIREFISHSSYEKYSSKLFDVSCDVYSYCVNYNFFINTQIADSPKAPPSVHCILFIAMPSPKQWIDIA